MRDDTMENIYYTSFMKHNRNSLNELAIKYGLEISKTDTKSTLSKKLSVAKANILMKGYEILRGN